MRQVAIELKNHGESIESFAPLIRLREILRRELLLSDKPTTTSITAREDEAREEEHEDDDNVKTKQVRRRIRTGGET